MKVSISVWPTTRIFFLLLVILFTSIDGNAQELKKVVESPEWPKGLVEVYHVLKKKKKVRHGAYLRMLKEQVEVKGQYENNRRTGVWEFYDRKGELAQKYDFSKGELLFNSGVIKELRLKNDVDEVPVYLGGVTEYYHAARGTRYPFLANRNGIQGKVVVAFDVNEQGEMVNVRLRKRIGGGCDEEALRITNLLSNGWVPAKKGGKLVPAELELSFNFKLSR